MNACTVQEAVGFKAAYDVLPNNKHPTTINTMAPVTEGMVDALDTLGSALLPASVDERMTLALADIATTSSSADAQAVQDCIDSINATLTESDMSARDDAPAAIERQRLALLDFAAFMDQEPNDAGVIYALAGSLAVAFCHLLPTPPCDPLGLAFCTAQWTATWSLCQCVCRTAPATARVSLPNPGGWWVPRTPGSRNCVGSKNPMSKTLGAWAGTGSGMQRLSHLFLSAAYVAHAVHPPVTNTHCVSHLPPMPSLLRRSFAEAQGRLLTESLTSFLAVVVLEPSVFLKLPLVARLAQAGQTVAVTARPHDILRLAWKVASTDKPFAGSPFADSSTACTQHAQNSDTPLKHTDLASSLLPGSTREQLQSALEKRGNIDPTDVAEATRRVTNDRVKPAMSPQKVTKTTGKQPTTRNSSGERGSEPTKTTNATAGKTPKIPTKRSATETGSSQKKKKLKKQVEPMEPMVPEESRKKVADKGKLVNVSHSLTRSTMRETKAKNASSASKAAVVAVDSGSAGATQGKSDATVILAADETGHPQIQRRSRRTGGGLTFGL